MGTVQELKTKIAAARGVDFYQVKLLQNDHPLLDVHAVPSGIITVILIQAVELAVGARMRALKSYSGLVSYKKGDVGRITRFGSENGRETVTVFWERTRTSGHEWMDKCKEWFTVVTEAGEIS